MSRFDELLLVKKYNTREVNVSCFVCFCCDDDNNDHGVCRADMARALARWRCLVASHEATKPLRRAM